MSYLVQYISLFNRKHQTISTPGKVTQL